MPDVYEIVTDRILLAMERGIVPWQKPWTGAMPTNLKTLKEYHGVNVVSLWVSEMCNEFKSSYWMTFNQCRDLGGRILKGSKSTPVVFYEPRGREIEKEDGTTELKVTHSVLRYYNVFNLDQTEGLNVPSPTYPKDPNALKSAEDLLAKMPIAPKYEEGGVAAYYSPKRDLVVLPHLDRFDSAEGYIATKFHEYAHSTGHESRLNREGVMGVVSFGSGDYSFEELVAELASAFLCAEVGCSSGRQIENSAAYLQNWMNVLKDDKRMLLQAASKARMAAEYIKGASTVKDSPKQMQLIEA